MRLSGHSANVGPRVGGRNADRQGNNESDLGKASFRLALVSILVMAAILRFRTLNSAPIWMDEAFTILAAQQPVSILLSRSLDLHPPLFYLMEKAWLGLGLWPGPAQVRVPAALLGVVDVGLLGLWVAQLVSRRAGLIAAAMLAVSTGHIYISQDARMYTLLLAGLILAQWGGFALAAGSGAARDKGLYIAGAVTTLYTHALAPLFLLVVNLASLASGGATGRAGQATRLLLRVNLMVAPLAIPWMWHVATLLRAAIE